MWSCARVCIQISNKNFRHFFTHCDTWNKQLNPTSCQLVPLYLMLTKTSFLHRDTGKKILEKMISRYPQLAVGKGKALQRQWGAKTIVPWDRPRTNRRVDAQKNKAWDRESPHCQNCWPTNSCWFLGPVNSQITQRQRKQSYLFAGQQISNLNAECEF